MIDLTGDDQEVIDVETFVVDVLLTHVIKPDPDAASTALLPMDVVIKLDPDATKLCEAGSGSLGDAVTGGMCATCHTTAELPGNETDEATRQQAASMTPAAVGPVPAAHVQTLGVNHPATATAKRKRPHDGKGEGELGPSAVTTVLQMSLTKAAMKKVIAVTGGSPQQLGRHKAEARRRAEAIVEALMAAAAKVAQHATRKAINHGDVTTCCSRADSALLFSSELPAPLPTSPPADAASTAGPAGEGTAGVFINVVGDGNILVNLNVVHTRPFTRDMNKLLVQLGSLAPRFPKNIESAALFFLRKAVCRDLYRFFHSIATGSPPPSIAGLVARHSAQLSFPKGALITNVEPKDDEDGDPHLMVANQARCRQLRLMVANKTSKELPAAMSKREKKVARKAKLRGRRAKRDAKKQAEQAKR